MDWSCGKKQLCCGQICGSCSSLATRKTQSAGQRTSRKTLVTWKSHVFHLNWRARAAHCCTRLTWKEVVPARPHRELGSCMIEYTMGVLLRNHHVTNGALRSCLPIRYGQAVCWKDETRWCSP